MCQEKEEPKLQQQSDSPSSTPSSAATEICKARTQERQRLQKVRRVYIPRALLHTDRCLIQENHSDHEFRTIDFSFLHDRHSLAWALTSWLGWLTYLSLPPQCTTHTLHFNMRPGYQNRSSVLRQALYQPQR